MIKNKKTLFFCISCLGISALWLWVYYGFWKPDPFALQRYHPLSTGLLCLLRIGLPAVTAFIIWMILRIRQKKMESASAGILAGVILILMLIALPIANALYEKTMSVKNRTAEYHPYLQLTPHAYIPAGGDTLNIVCLGGSTTEFTDQEGLGWPDRVQHLLQVDRPVCVHNLGRQWYTSLHSLINYQTNILPFKPDMILVMHNINDVLHNADFSYFSHRSFRADYGHFYGPVNRIVLSQSLWGFIKEFVGYLWYHTPRTIIETDIFPGLPAFRQNLQNIITLSQSEGSQIVLMTQPSLYQPKISKDVENVLYMLNNEAIGPNKRWDYQTAFKAMTQYNDAIRQLTEENQILLIDLDAAIPKTLDYFYDDVHYRTAAYDSIASIIAKKIRISAPSISTGH